MDVIPDLLNRYSMIGGGADQGEICPNSPFVQTLENIGDSIVFVFPGGNMSCAKTVLAKCGAPAIRVLPESVEDAPLYKVWFLEYDASKVEQAEQMFSKSVPFEERKETGVMPGMSRLDQEFYFSGLAS